MGGLKLEGAGDLHSFQTWMDSLSCFCMKLLLSATPGSSCIFSAKTQKLETENPSRHSYSVMFEIQDSGIRA